MAKDNIDKLQYIHSNQIITEPPIKTPNLGKDGGFFGGCDNREAGFA